jgi:hypothetical protein
MIEDQLSSSINSIPAKFALAPHDLARRSDQPVDEQRHEAVARRQILALALDLQSPRGEQQTATVGALRRRLRGPASLS